MTEEIISQDPFTIPPTPSQIPVESQGVPEFLSNARQWIGWKYVWNGSKWGKVPHVVDSDGSIRRAKAEDRAATNLNLAEALEVLKAHPSLSGVGFVVSGKSNIWAFDADNCTDPEFGLAGGVDTDVEAFMSEAKCYLEYSPSWAGIRGFGLMPDSGTVPMVRSFLRKANGDKESGREMYFPHPTKTHFVTVTGRVIPEKSVEVVPAEAEFLAKWYQTWVPVGSSEFDADTAGMSPPVVDGVRVLSVDEGGLSQADLDVLYSGSLDTGGKDRSSYMQGLSNRVYLAGLSREEGWSVLAGCGLARELCSGKTEGLEWLWKFTVAKAWAGCGRMPAAEEFDVVSEGSDVSDGSDAGRFDRAAVSRKFEWQKLDEFSLGYLKSNYLIRGVLDCGELAMVFGPSGAGKTFMVLDMMYALARGLPYWRAPEHKIRAAVPVWYVCAEGRRGFERRVRAYAVKHGIGEAELGALPFWVLADRPDFHKSDSDVLALCDSVGDGASGGLIVIDTMAQVAAGADENSSEMGLIIGRCQTLAAKTGAMVLLVHHSGKDIEKGSRGWSGLKGPLDSEFGITGERGDPAKCMEITKSKDSEDGVLFPFHLEIVKLGVDEDLDPITSCVVVHDLNPTGVVSKPMAKKGPNMDGLIERIIDLRRTGPVSYNRIRTHTQGLGINSGDLRPLLDVLRDEGRLVFVPCIEGTPGGAKGHYEVVSATSGDGYSDF